MNEKETTGWGCFGLVVYILVVMVVAAICVGWAIKILWGWFIVPIFGLPILTAAQAIGIGMTVGLLTGKSATTKKEEGDTLELAIKAMTYAVGMPAMTVGIAWIVTQFL